MPACPSKQYALGRRPPELAASVLASARDQASSSLTVPMRRLSPRRSLHDLNIRARACRRDCSTNEARPCHPIWHLAARRPAPSLGLRRVSYGTSGGCARQGVRAPSCPLRARSAPWWMAICMCASWARAPRLGLVRRAGLSQGLRSRFALGESRSVTVSARNSASPAFSR